MVGARLGEAPSAGPTVCQRKSPAVDAAASDAKDDGLAPLGREEYVEQAHFFGTLGERLGENVPAQEVLASVREEVLATAKLPMAIDFLLAELRHAGAMHTAMRKLPHYFTEFQAFVIAEAEDDRGKFDFRMGLEVLRRESLYRAEGATHQGLFFYQFEVLCRNRLGYDRGLAAMAADPAFVGRWAAWLKGLRRQIGMVELADIIYVASEHARQIAQRKGLATAGGDEPALFGDREGRIALANRRKDPLFFFASLHRQLGYPEVPRPARPTEAVDQLPQLARRLEQLERRLLLVEEEQRGGIDITKFYQQPGQGPS